MDPAASREFRVCVHLRRDLRNHTSPAVSLHRTLFSRSILWSTYRSLFSRCILWSTYRPLFSLHVLWSGYWPLFSRCVLWSAYRPLFLHCVPWSAYRLMFFRSAYFSPLTSCCLLCVLGCDARVLSSIPVSSLL